MLNLRQKRFADEYLIDLNATAAYKRCRDLDGCLSAIKAGLDKSVELSIPSVPRETMKIERVSVIDLMPYARNSRTHSEAQVAQIAESIREFGFTNPVLIDAENGIIAGHGRVLAAQKLRLIDLPCVRLSHLTEIQKRAYTIADNKLALNAGWDEDLLKLELVELDEFGFDLELTGFSIDEIADLTAEDIPEGLTDEDAVPDVPPEPASKLGDVWILGKHRVMCGDSTSIDAVEVLMAGSLADQPIEAE